MGGPDYDRFGLTRQEVEQLLTSEEVQNIAEAARKQGLKPEIVAAIEKVAVHRKELEEQNGEDNSPVW